jgi:hypothetical protein
MAIFVGIGTTARQWELGKGAELLTQIATSRNVGPDSVESTNWYAFLRSAYDLAGLLGQLGPEMSADVVDRLRQSTSDFHKARRKPPWRRPQALEHYIAAVTAAHTELDRIIREERLEARSRRISLLSGLPFHRH